MTVGAWRWATTQPLDVTDLFAFPSPQALANASTPRPSAPARALGVGPRPLGSAVVCGVGCRVAGSPDAAQFWRLLSGGVVSAPNSSFVDAWRRCDGLPSSGIEGCRAFQLLVSGVFLTFGSTLLSTKPHP